MTQAYLCQRDYEKVADAYFSTLAGLQRDQGEAFFNAIGYALNNLASLDEACLEDIEAARGQMEGLLSK